MWEICNLPHAYVPSAMHMGDCDVCGHSQKSAIHGLPVGCCDEHDERIAMVRYMVACAFREGLRDRNTASVAMTVMGIARMIALDLLEERGMSRRRAKQLLDDRTKLLMSMTDKMAKEAGFIP